MDMTRVAAVMSADVYTFTEKTPIREAVDGLLRRKIIGAPVLGRNDKPVGVVTIVDLTHDERPPPPRPGYPLFYRMTEELPRQVDGRALSGRVGDMMKPFVLSIESSATLVEAAQRMLGEEVHRLLVMDDTRLVGVVTSMDLLRGFALESRERT